MKRLKRAGAILLALALVIGLLPTGWLHTHAHAAETQTPLTPIAGDGKTWLHAVYDADGIALNGIREYTYPLTVELDTDLMMGAVWNLEYLYFAVNSDVEFTTLQVNGKDVSTKYVRHLTYKQVKNEETGKMEDTDEIQYLPFTEYRISLRDAGISSIASGVNTVTVQIGEAEAQTLYLIFENNNYTRQKLTSNNNPDKDLYYIDFIDDYTANYVKNSGLSLYNGNTQKVLAGNLDTPTVVELDLDIGRVFYNSTTGADVTSSLATIGHGITVQVVDEYREPVGGTATELFKFGFITPTRVNKDFGALYFRHAYIVNGVYTTADVRIADTTDQLVHVRVEYYYAPDSNGVISHDSVVSAKYYINGKFIAEATNVRIAADGTKQTGNLATSSKNLVRVQAAYVDSTKDNYTVLTASNFSVSYANPVKLSNLAAAVAVQSEIAELGANGTVTQAQIDAVKASYDALDASVKSLVPNRGNIDLAQAYLNAAAQPNYLHAVYAEGGEGEKPTITFDGTKVSAAWDWDNLYLTGATKAVIGEAEVVANEDQIIIPWDEVLGVCLTEEAANISRTLTFAVGDETWTGTLVLCANDYDIQTSMNAAYGTQKEGTGAWRLNSIVKDANFDNAKRDILFATSDGNSYPYVNKLQAALNQTNILEFDVTTVYMPDIHSYRDSANRDFAFGGLSVAVIDGEAYTGTEAREAILAGLARTGNVLYLGYFDGEKVVEIPVDVYESGKEYHLRFEFTYPEAKQDDTVNNDVVNIKIFVNGKLVVEDEDVKAIHNKEINGKLYSCSISTNGGGNGHTGFFISTTDLTNDNMLSGSNTRVEAIVKNVSVSNSDVVETNAGANAGCNWKDPTCTAPKTCMDCGATEGTALDHAYGEDGKCTNGCNNFACQNGEAEHGDSDGDHNHSCDACGKENITECTGGTADCQNKAVCTECGKAYGEVDPDNHVGGLGEWVTDAEKHWHVCTGCGETFDAENHSYDDSDDMICDECHYDRTPEHVCADEVELVKGQEATCEIPGFKPYYSCSCGYFYEDADCTVLISDINEWKNGDGKIPVKDHSFGTPEYAWAEDYSTYTATRECACGEKEVANATVTSKIDAPSCLVAGKITYTATFAEDWAEDATKEVAGEAATGHHFGTPVYAWAADNSAYTATRECACGEKEVANATVTSKIDAPSCLVAGKITYTATFAEDWAEDATKEVAGEAATGHSFGTPEYAWAEDYSTYTATRECACGEKEVANATVTSKIDAPSCLVNGKITYTATFAEDWAEDATKEVAGEAATGHTPGEAVKENETSASLNAPGSYEEVVYCSVCKAELSRVEKEIPQLTGAVAEVNGVKYGTLQAAIDAAQDGETITLLADVNLAVGVEFNKAIVLTLNLNGKTITSEQDAIVVTAGTLIIEGNGNVIAATSQVGSWCAVWANGGDVVINGGTYKTYGEPAGPDLPHQNDSIYAKNGSTITINGGYFEYVEYVWTLNVSDKAPGKIIVYGGKFENFDPANNVSRDNFVASGKHTKCVEGIYSICEGEYAENGYCSVCGAENPAAAFVAQIGQKKYLSFAEAYADAEAGDTIILLADLKLSQILTIDKAITLDGNGKTLTSTATRAINIETTGAVKIKDLTIVAGERAINIINKAGVVTLNNVTATAKNNAVMIATSAGAVKLTINNSNLTGLAVVNVAGAGAQVEITNTVITNVDATEAENYGAITIWDTASQAVVTVTGGTITVAGDSKQAYVFPADATIKGVAEVGYIIATVGDAGFEDLQTAIDEAIKSGKTIEMVRDYIALADIINGTGVTIDLNGCTLEADILATIKVNGGTFKTSEYTMVAGENACYISTDAIFTISGANLDTTVHSGTLTLGRPEGWTNAGQLLVIEEGATFIIPANFKLYVQSTVVVKGNVQVDGTVVLYGADATIQAPEGLNVITTGDKVVYTEGKYTVHNHTEETVTGKDATCTDTGLTNGVKCSVCGETLTAQKEIPAKGHTNGTPVKENEVPATLNAPGSYDEVVYCSVCKAELSRVEKEIPQLTGAVAEIDGFKYGSLQEAIDAANGKTVTLIADINLGSDYVIVKAGNVVTLDLNGKTISGVSNGNGEPCMIRVENTAKLTIEDSGENGKITLARGTNGTAFVIDVKGDLVLNSGILEMTGSWSIGFVVDIRPNAWGTSYTAPTSFTMNGGKIISGDGAVRVDSNSGTNERLGVTFTMNGGEIDAVYDAVFIQHRYANDLYVNIAGGILSSDFAPIRIYGSEVISNVYINISGGTFNYTGAAGGTGWVVENFLKASNAVLADAAEFNITGGSFEGDITDLLADDQHVTENEGIYTICSGKHVAVVTKPDCINGGYTTYTCPVCADEYVADKTNALGHTEETVTGKAPTCTETGLTDGVKCSVCGKTLTAQKEIPATGHDFENGSCNVCGAEDPNYVEILTQPTDAEVALGAEAQFTVVANNQNVTYQWYFSNAEGKWAMSSAADATTATLTVKAMAYRNGYQYKCAIISANGEITWSDVVTLTVKNSDAVITAQPENADVGVGENAVFTVVLNNTEGVTYQWYYSNNGTDWTKTSMVGANSATLTVPMLAYRDGNQYMCVITDQYGNVIETEPAKLTLKKDDVKITTEPADVTVANGANAQFTVTLNKTNGVTYQWYYSNAEGKWAMASAADATTATLTVNALTYRNGYQYKCVITDAFGNTSETREATLTVVNSSVEIVAQPENADVGVGENAVFTVVLNNTEGVTYQWYYSNAEGKWAMATTEGSDTATLTVPMLAYRNNNLYKCVITDVYGNVIESNEVKLTQKSSNVEITAQPENAEVAIGENAQFSVVVNNADDVVSYQWYYSNAEGKWAMTTTEDSDTATLTVLAKAYRDGYRYKCVITDVFGNIIESEVATLIIE